MLYIIAHCNIVAQHEITVAAQRSNSTASADPRICVCNPSLRSGCVSLPSHADGTKLSTDPSRNGKEPALMHLTDLVTLNHKFGILNCHPILFTSRSTRFISVQKTQPRLRLSKASTHSYQPASVFTYIPGSHFSR